MPELYSFQKQAVEALQLPHKHIICAPCGCGKTIIALKWVETTNKPKWLVVTTPAARDSKQWHKELQTWFKESLSSISLEVVSWAGLAKWTTANWRNLDEYAFVFDEIKRASAGVSSAQGRSFLQITKRSDCWTGFTATPGDKWIDFCAYLIAGGYVANKTAFKREFCEEVRYKGYPEIIGYRDTDILQRYWRRMAYWPDTSALLKELPPERHRTHQFKADAEYKRLAQTHCLPDGTLLDTPGAFSAAARRACFSRAKQAWLADYLHDLGEPCVIFYALTETGDRICELARKALPKSARVWRVSGDCHEIPTASAIGKRDVVVCQWQAGSEALNLQFMSQWVAAEMCYAYWQLDQARGRVRRIGQQAKYIQYHYLKCPQTIEDNVFATVLQKKDFSMETWYAQNN